MRTYETLSEAVSDLKIRGYQEDFNLLSHYVECQAQDKKFHPEEFTIDEFYRFEGMTNPDDNSVVYAITSADGLKGVLVDAYGVYAENLSPTMTSKFARL